MKRQLPEVESKFNQCPLTGRINSHEVNFPTLNPCTVYIVQTYITPCKMSWGSCWLPDTLALFPSSYVQEPENKTTLSIPMLVGQLRTCKNNSCSTCMILVMIFILHFRPSVVQLCWSYTGGYYSRRILLTEVQGLVMCSAGRTSFACYQQEHIRMGGYIVRVCNSNRKAHILVKIIESY